MMSYAGGTHGYGSLATLDFQRQHLELLEVIMAHQHNIISINLIIN